MKISRFCTLNKNHNGNHRKAVDVFTSFNSTKKDGQILKRIEKGRIEAQNKNDMSIFKEQSIQQVVCCKCIELGKKEHKSTEKKNMSIRPTKKKFFVHQRIKWIYVVAVWLGAGRE